MALEPIPINIKLVAGEPVIRTRVVENVLTIKVSEPVVLTLTVQEGI